MITSLGVKIPPCPPNFMRQFTKRGGLDYHPEGQPMEDQYDLNDLTPQKPLKRRLSVEPEAQKKGEMKKCIDCGDDYLFSDGEKEWLQKKFGENFAAPRRCRKCREQRKLKRQQNESLKVNTAP